MAEKIEKATASPTPLDNVDTNTPLFQYDRLKMYLNWWGDYHITDKITIHQPTVKEIAEYGDTEFFGMVGAICANPTSMRLELWDMGIDWNKISDYQLFLMQYSNWEVDRTRILFGDLDFQKFKLDTESNVLIYIPDITIQIDELVYLKIVDYLKFMFNIYPKVEHAKGKITKEFIIEEERANRRAKQKKEEQNPNQNTTSVLLSMISSAVNHPGFKYKKNELKDVGIIEFLDSVRRLKLYEVTRAITNGIYGGFVNTKDIDVDKQTDWTRDMYSES